LKASPTTETSYFPNQAKKALRRSAFLWFVSLGEQRNEQKPLTRPWSNITQQVKTQNKHPGTSEDSQPESNKQQAEKI
jgi:hypothetical protein